MWQVVLRVGASLVVLRVLGAGGLLVQHLVHGPAVAALASGVGLAGLPQLGAVEVGPGQGREVELGVGGGPHEEVGGALLVAGADEQVHVPHGG